MKILRYYPRAARGDGGITASVHSSAEAMSRLGADVTVLYDGDPSEPASSTRGGFRLVPVAHTGRSPARVPVGMARLLRDADVLVLHSAWTAHNLAAARAAREAGTPYVLEPRGAYDPHIVNRRRMAKAVWWRLAEAGMVRRSVAVHIFFASEGPHLERLGYRGPQVTAPNGVRVPKGYEWDGGSGEYLLWLGRFDPEHKGLDILLDAVSRLSATDRPRVLLHGPDWRGQKRVVAEMVADRGLQHTVDIGPPLYGEEKFAAMCAARAFVYPSRWEGFGNSVAEAAALGTPVLTTQYPLGSYLHDRKAGLASAPTPASLACGLLKILDKDAAEMGSRARKIAATEFRWDAIAQTWLDQVGALL